MTSARNLEKRLDAINDTTVSSEHGRIMLVEGYTRSLMEFEKCYPFLSEAIHLQLFEVVKAARDSFDVNQRGRFPDPFEDGYKQATHEIAKGLRQLPIEVQDQVIAALRAAKDPKP